MKKFVKISLIAITSLLGTFFLIFSMFLGISFIKYSSLPLNKDNLTSASLNISIFDKNNNLIKEENTFNGKYVKLSSLPQYIPDSFISIEDKKFYSHKGINYSRIIKACLENVKSFSYKEGASTISQQLIKNSHLSGEKTINRKIKEISLTRKLEKNFSKEEILEFYINIIYFGNNTYGIEEASNYYFSKESKDLTIGESALLAGMIKSPNKYSPIKHKENALYRRNLVLSEMAKDGKISYSDEIRYKSEPILLKINNNKINKLNSYTEQTIDEAVSILKMPAKQIAIGNYKIYTYQNPKTQNKLQSTLSNASFENNDYCGIVIDNKSHGISAFNGCSAYKILENKRQPGSLIKPLLVYAPALEENIIYPSTMILDEEISISGFSPKNSNGKYVGYVSAKESLAKSINIPAVKVLSYTGINKAKEYGKRMNLLFDEKDNSYALALGGMTYGTSLKEITNAFTTFANQGRFAEAKFIHFITDKNGNVIYKHEPYEKQIFRDDTAYLITDMLKESAKSGTAKKLKNLSVPIASKTGTVGIKGLKENTDAWNVSYTTENTVGIWVGNLDNTPISISGGNQPTEVVKTFYNDCVFDDFKQPSSITQKEIDLIELNKNHKVVLSNNATPSRYKQNALFSRFNEPEECSANFIVPPLAEAYVEVNGDNKTLIIKAKEHLKYILMEETTNNTIKEIDNSNDNEIITLENGKNYILKTTYIDNSLENIKRFSLEPVEKSFTHQENKIKKKWYI